MRVSAVILAAGLGLTGCSSHVTSAVMPGADLRELRNAYVVCRPEEDANICQMLAANLQSHGFTAQTGLGPPPPETQVVVTYEDRWTWDMATYLLNLRVDMRDPHTNVLLATSQVFATSLVRRSPARMAKESIDAIVAGKGGS